MAIPAGIKVAGSLTPCECPQYYRISRVNGNVFTRSWRGLYTEVQALVPQLYAGGATEVEYRQEPGAPVAEVTAYYNTNPIDPLNAAVETVELDFVQTHESIFRNPRFEAITPARLRVLKRLFQKVETIAQGDDPAVIEAEIAAVTAMITDVTELAAWNLLLLEQDTYEVELPVVVHTRTVFRGYTTKIALATSGKIHTTAQVVSATGLPILFDVPDSVNNIGEPDGFVLGWKKLSKVQFIANGNAQMVEQYRYKAWSTDLYDLAP